MRSRSNARFRFALLAPLVGAILAVSAPAAHAAVEIEKFVGVNCQATPKNVAKRPSEKILPNSRLRKP